MNKGLILILVGFLLNSCGADLDILEFAEANGTILLVFPENDSECTEGSLVSETQSEVVFEWMDETASAPYTVYLTNVSTSQTELFQSDTNEISIVLELGVSYIWYITGAFNSSSEIGTFYNAGPGLKSAIPLPAIAISPVSGAAISQTSTTVNLIWRSEDDDDDIVGYDLYFGESKDPPLYQSDIIETRLNGIPVSAGKTYYWKIVTRDRIGNESTSQIFVFTVG